MVGEIWNHLKVALCFIGGEVAIGLVLRIAKYLNAVQPITCDRVDRMLGWFLVATVTVFLVSAFLKFLLFAINEFRKTLNTFGHQ